MRTVVMDSCGVDPIADLPGAYEAAQEAVASGRLEILYTHVNIDELAATPDLNRRGHLLLTLVSLGRLVPTGALALDVSRWGHARLNDDVEVIEALRVGNIDNTRDALIAVTAIYEQCALVTNEHKLAGRARRRGVEVLTTSELLTEIGYVGP